MQTVSGIFNNSIDTEKALSELMAAGFSKDNLSVIVSDETRDTLFSNTTDEDVNRVARGGLTGAAIGGVFGALLAAFTAVGSIFVPGSGLIIAGPVVAALSGAGAGAALGGFSGALIQAGFSADEANRYEKEIKAGKTVILVHTDSEYKAEIARIALMNAGALKAEAA